MKTNNSKNHAENVVLTRIPFQEYTKTEYLKDSMKIHLNGFENFHHHYPNPLPNWKKKLEKYSK